MRDIREHAKLAILTFAAFVSTMCAEAQAGRARVTGESSCLTSK